MENAWANTRRMATKQNERKTLLTFWPVFQIKYSHVCNISCASYIFVQVISIVFGRIEWVLYRIVSHRMVCYWKRCCDSLRRWVILIVANAELSTFSISVRCTIHITHWQTGRQAKYREKKKTNTQCTSICAHSHTVFLIKLRAFDEFFHWLLLTGFS